MQIKQISKWMVKHWILSLICLALIGLGLWQTYERNMSLSDWILALTAIAIFIYTYWTYKQTDAIVRPVCTAEIYTDKFYIMNEGLGPALNIKAKYIEIESQGSKYGFSFKEIYAIEKGQPKELEISQEFVNNKRAKKGTIKKECPNWINEIYNLNIIYKDCKGKEYQAIIECKKR